MKEDLLTSVFDGLRVRLRSSVRRLLGDEAVDDVLQEAFVRLWSRREQLSGKSAIEGVAATTVKNICIDAIRRNGTRRHEQIDERVSSQADPSERESEVRETYAEVMMLIENSLGERERKVLYMRDRDEMEFADIAEALDISEGSVRVIISRARKTVRELYLKRNQNHL